MKPSRPHEPLQAGPWQHRDAAFAGMRKALEAKAEELGGVVGYYELRRNGKQSYGARGVIRLTSGKERTRYFEAGVI